MITSLQNERVKNWAKLKEKKYRDETGQYLIEGDHLLKEALKANVVLEILSLEPVEDKTVPSFLVTKEILKYLSCQVTPPSVIAVCKKKKEQEITGAVLILDGLQDPGNLGTLIRSAVAFNIETIIASLDTVDYYNPKVIRSTEGMHFYVNLIRSDLQVTLPKLQEKGYTIYTTNVQTGKHLKEIVFPKNSAFIIGNEGSGVRPDTAELATQTIYIPMSKTCESLNASVSGSIIMYEYGREWLS